MKLIFLIGLLALLSGAYILFNKSSASNELFTNYKIEWNKSYPNKEVEEYRMAIFYDNLAKIEEHNATDPELLEIKADLTNRLGLTDGEPMGLRKPTNSEVKTE